MLFGCVVLAGVMAGCTPYERISASEFMDRYGRERYVYDYHEYEGVFVLHHHLSHYSEDGVDTEVKLRVVYTCPGSELPEGFPERAQSEVREPEHFRGDPLVPFSMVDDSQTGSN